MSTHNISPTTAPRAGSLGPDYRSYERYRGTGEAICRPVTGGDGDCGWLAQIRNVSQGGLALVLRRRFEPGAGLAVELLGADPETSSTVLVRVVHVCAQPDEFWLLDCAFLSDLSEDEVQVLTGIPAEAKE
jgi:hypothetical protein